jgi:HSP20 family protein
VTSTPTGRRESTSLVGDLMSLFGGVQLQPEIRVEEYQEGERRIVRADLPGVDPDKDIDVTVDGGFLRIHGHRRAEEHDKYRTEIRYGSFERVLTLPTGTRAEDVKADYADGVLTVSMPALPSSAEPSVIAVSHHEPPVD